MRTPKTFITWPDRHPRAAAAFAMPEKILDLAAQYPWAAAALAVPLTVLALSLVVAYPWLFLPLLVMVGVALVVTSLYMDQKSRSERRSTTSEQRTRATVTRDKANSASKFEISRDDAGSFRFQLKSATGETVATSQGYETKAGVDRAIQAVKSIAANAKVEDLSLGAES